MLKKGAGSQGCGVEPSLRSSFPAELGAYVFLAASRCLLILWFVSLSLPMFPLACIIEVAANDWKPRLWEFTGGISILLVRKVRLREVNN